MVMVMDMRYRIALSASSRSVMSVIQTICVQQMHRKWSVVSVDVARSMSMSTRMRFAIPRITAWIRLRVITMRQAIYLVYSRSRISWTMMVMGWVIHWRNTRIHAVFRRLLMDMLRTTQIVMTPMIRLVLYRRGTMILMEMV